MTATMARQDRERRAMAASRREEFLWLLLASLVIACALFLVFEAKKELASDSAARLTQHPLLNLNTLRSERDLLPYLEDLSVPAEQSFIAARIFHAVRGIPAANVGTLARLRVLETELKQHPDLTALASRMAEQAQIQERENQKRLRQVSWLGERIASWRAGLFPLPAKDPSITLLSRRQFNNLKPWLIVRDIGDFRWRLLLWSEAFFASFYVVHFYWRYRGFAGDNLILPAIHLLTGLGLALMISARDPLRDSMIFSGFAAGVALGALVMGALALVDYDRLASRFSYVFLAAAVLLGIALAIFGGGPAGSRAKVNLFFFQPVEVIRILLVFFLAGYFAGHWEVLRDLRQKSAQWRGLTSRLHIPRLDHLIPVLAGTLLAIGLFFYFQDLGPALVIGFLFIILYAVARNRAVALTACCLLFIGGLAAVHTLRAPDKVENRIEIFLDPWRNTVRNGDQIAHSLWALASGGWQGSGLGMGRPSSVPAGQTDLVLAVAGEEYGFVGLACIALLYWLLAARAFRISLNAATPYGYFLVTGLNLIILLQLFLIAAGCLDAFPLSGVVSPFLSLGKTSMAANFAAFGIILAISAAPSKGQQKPHFRTANRVLGTVFGLLAVALIGKAAYVQVIAADDIAMRDVEVVYPGDGSAGLDYNPRIKALVRDLPRGDIFDRNGLPMATSSMATVERHRAEYERLGVNLNETAVKGQQRFYPLGPRSYYLVENFRGKDLRNRLRGFDDRREKIQLDPENKNTWLFRYDYAELLPLLRHRYDPGNAEVRALMNRERDVRLSIDSALQLRASAILEKHLAKSGKKGALAVLDAATGELLAAVSYPWPGAAQFAEYRANPEHELQEDLIDRARYGRYPPGSSFKLVTAAAALRADPALARKTYTCEPLGGGRVGAYVNMGGKIRIRDDAQDRAAHGTIAMGKGIEVSCNAYFAQLGTYDAGAQRLIDTAGLFGIAVARVNTPRGLGRLLPQASYGQGEVLARPVQMARVAAAIANHGILPPLYDEGNNRVSGPVTVLPAALADELGGFMRAVVVSGTGQLAAAKNVAVAGKTGTAEVSEGGSHAWFVGFAPYGDGGGRKIAFAVLVEHGHYGGTAAAPIAAELVAAAHDLGLL